MGIERKMKLTYRGRSYDHGSSVDAKSSETIKLRYNGLTIERSLSDLTAYSAIPEGLGKDKAQKVKLTYNGLVVDHIVCPPLPYRKPRAMNWRLEMILEKAAAAASI
jgi:hypothetical protein